MKSIQILLLLSIINSQSALNTMPKSFSYDTKNHGV